MKKILCLLILIELFNFLKADTLMVCQQNEGICCAIPEIPDTCKCVTTSIPNCNIYSPPCGDGQRRVYINTGGSAQIKCIE